MSEEKKKSWFRRHWILTIFLCFMVLGMFGSLNNDSTQNLIGDSVSEKLPKFNPEVTNVGTSLTMYKVINRNNYPWHHVEITVNNHYSCWSRDVLEPGDSIAINAVTCNQFAINNQIVQYLDIKADEGAERYSLK